MQKPRAEGYFPLRQTLKAEWAKLDPLFQLPAVIVCIASRSPKLGFVGLWGNRVRGRGVTRAHLLLCSLPFLLLLLLHLLL